jgi:adhesin/invasin
MSKNLTRKGLALGALVALGSTLFAGAPAFAGTESAKVTLVPTVGTTYTTLIGASFDLKTELDDTLDNLDGKDFTELTYVITNPSAQKLHIDLDGASGAAFGVVKYQTADAAADVAGAYTGTYDAVDFKTSKAIVVTHSTVSQSADNDDVGPNTLRIKTSTDSTDAFSVTVQAFLDDNRDGIIGALEYTSPVRTLNFIKASAATVTTTVTTSTIGGTVLEGTVVIGNDVNNRSLEGQVSIGFFKNAAAYKLNGAANASVDTVDVSWDTVDGVLKNKQYNTTSAIATGNYTAKAYFGVDRAVIGTESVAVTPLNGTVTSADHTDFVLSTASSNVLVGTVSAAATTSVRSGYTGAVNFKTSVLNTNNAGSAAIASTGATRVKVAGVKVKVTLTKGSTFGSTHTVTAGGKTLTATSGAVSYEALTDANGEVAIAATSNLGTADDAYVVTVSVLTDDSGWQTTTDANTVTFTAATNTTKSLETTDLAGSGAQLQVAKGGSLSVKYLLRDQFGAASTVAGTYRVSVASSNPTGGASIAGTAALSNGEATFTFTDNTVTATGSYTLTATLQKLNTAGTAYDAISVVNKVLVVNVGTAAVTDISVPSNHTAAGLLVSPKDFVSHDLRLDANSKTWAGIGHLSVDGTDAFVVTGTATSASGASVPGALVTVALTGGQLVAINDSVANALLAVDSITVRANSSGVYSVLVYSHKAGVNSIKVTSGSSTKTVTATWAYPSAADADSKLTITGANILKAGRSSSFAVALTDKWGNAIKSAVTVDVAQDGAGYLVSTPTAVGATTGTARLNLITQPADGGLTTLTVTYDVAGTTTDVVATKSILVGVSASITKAATSKVTVKNAAGLTVKVVRGTKSSTKTATSDSYKVSLKGGKGTVSVYVNGIKVASK